MTVRPGPSERSKFGNREARRSRGIRYLISSSVEVRESHEAAKPLPYMARSHKLTKQFEEFHAEITSC